MNPETNADDLVRTGLTVVYDRRDGRVVHVHEFLSDGPAEGRGPDADERARTALAAVRSIGHYDAAGLAVSHAPDDLVVEAGTRFRVDVGTGEVTASRTDADDVRQSLARRLRRAGGRPGAATAD